jgi:hypothetical protein
MLLANVTLAGLLPGRKSPSIKISPPPVLPPVPVSAPNMTATLVVDPTLLTRNVPFCVMSS